MAIGGFTIVTNPDANRHESPAKAASAGRALAAESISKKNHCFSLRARLDRAVQTPHRARTRDPACALN
jgi:hypothetical protein